MALKKLRIQTIHARQPKFRGLGSARSIGLGRTRSRGLVSGHYGVSIFIAFFDTFFAKNANFFQKFIENFFRRKKLFGRSFENAKFNLIRTNQSIITLIIS